MALFLLEILCVFSFKETENEQINKNLPASPLRDLLLMSFPTFPRSSLLLYMPSAMMIHVSLSFVRMGIILLPFTHHGALKNFNLRKTKKCKPSQEAKGRLATNIEIRLPELQTEILVASLFLNLLRFYSLIRHQVLLLGLVDCIHHWLINQPAPCLLFYGIKALVLLPSVN